MKDRRMGDEFTKEVVTREAWETDVEWFSDTVMLFLSFIR